MSEGACGYLRISSLRLRRSDAGILYTVIALGPNAMQILRHTLGSGIRPANESAPSILYTPPRIGTKHQILAESGGIPLRPQDIFGFGQSLPHSTYSAYESQVDTPLYLKVPGKAGISS